MHTHPKEVPGNTLPELDKEDGKCYQSVAGLPWLRMLALSVWVYKR